MKNLENYGVLEMNAKEISETDGGFSPVFEWMIDEALDYLSRYNWDMFETDNNMGIPISA